MTAAFFHQSSISSHIVVSKELYCNRIVQKMFNDKQRSPPESVNNDFQCGKTGSTLQVFVFLLYKETLTSCVSIVGYNYRTSLILVWKISLRNVCKNIKRNTFFLFNLLFECIICLFQCICWENESVDYECLYEVELNISF